MIWFTGDLNYCDGYFDTGIGTGSLIEAGANPFNNIPHNDEDIWVGNFECVCSNISSLKGTPSKQFIISPEKISSIWHPQVYAVANNHVMQHGQEAYQQLLQNIKSFGSEFVGSNDKKSIIFPHMGKRIAISAFSQRPENFKYGTDYWSCPEYNEIEREFTHIKLASDFKVVYIHWGIEFMNYPYLDQRKFAHWLIDLGYDLIIGMHPHVLQGYEIYKGKHIFYSLGNTIFNMAWYKTQYGALVSLDLSKNKENIRYQYIRIKDCFPSIVDEKDVPADCRFEYLNKLLNKDIDNEKYHFELKHEMSKYRKANYKKIMRDITHLKPKVVKSMILDYIKRHI